MVVSARSTRSQRQYRYDVERDCGRHGFVDVGLVRRQAPHGRFQRLYQHGRDEELMLFHRAFRPLLELFALETYAGLLTRVAQHANDGTFGCFVVIDPRVGMLQIRLYERWFDGQRLHVDELAKRVFDPGDDGTLVCGAEFLAELRDWAERRNEEREAAYLEASAEDASRTQHATERERVAEELARILA
jgi:hypothetical protein